MARMPCRGSILDANQAVMLVVAAVIERAGRILIGQRRACDPHPLKWEFPGGKVEPGETPEQALIRELREELAIEAVIGPEIARYRYSFELIFYRIGGFTGEPVNLAFEQLVWEVPTKLRSYDFLEGDIEFVAHVSGLPFLTHAARPP